MARKLKVFQTSLGFFGLAIAAPSMKAALEAWGSDSNLFHQGAAKESDDPDVVAATMSKPGLILRRPVGSDRPFREHADLPTHLSGETPPTKEKAPAKTKKQRRRGADVKTDREAALAFEKQQRLRESERRKEAAAREREREQRQQAIAKAQGALGKAEREHDERTASIDSEMAVLQTRSEAEKVRWGKQKETLVAALRRARDWSAGGASWRALALSLPSRADCTHAGYRQFSYAVQ
jgi:hypothetical protein